MLLAFVVSTAQAQTETIVFSVGSAPWGTGYNGNVKVTPNYAITTSWSLTFTLPTGAKLETVWPSNNSANIGTLSYGNGVITGTGTVNIPANTAFVVNLAVSGVTNNAAPTNFVFTSTSKTGTPISALNCASPSNIFPCIGNVGIGIFDASTQPQASLHVGGNTFLHGKGETGQYSVLFTRSNTLYGYLISEQASGKKIMTFSNSQTSGMNNRPSVSIGEPINPYYRTFEVNGGHSGIYGTIGSDAASQQNLLQLVSRRTNAVSKVGGTHYLNFSHDLYPNNQEYSIINSHECKDPSGPEAPKDLIFQNNNGNVGIGYYTAPLTERLHVTGNIRLNGTSTNGLIFPDGTKLTSSGFYSAQGAQIATPGSFWSKAGTNITYLSGNVLIGTSVEKAAGYKMYVNGKILAKGLRCDVNGWSDFVFEPNYELMPLEKVEQYIAKEHHLPNVPSEQEVKAQGIDLVEMNAILLRKIEENTLYLLQMKKENEVLKAEINQIKSK